MSVVIICAERGAGKTSFLCERLAEMAAQGRSVGGIAAPAVFESGRRIGYDLLDLREDSRRPLARVDPAAGGTAGVGPYQFDEGAVAAGNAAIAVAVRDGLDFVAIDEIGPLEFAGRGWAPALESALQACSPEQTLIVVVRPTLVDELPRRFPSPAWTGATRITPPWPVGSVGTGHSERAQRPRKVLPTAKGPDSSLRSE